eukprot:12558-Prymnesium_polylepis.2
MRPRRLDNAAPGAAPAWVRSRPAHDQTSRTLRCELPIPSLCGTSRTPARRASARRATHHGRRRGSTSRRRRRHPHCAWRCGWSTHEDLELRLRRPREESQTPGGVAARLLASGC